MQNLNPPVFTWIYYENPQLFSNNGYRKYAFLRLQLSPNANFSPLTWDIVCSNNF